MSRKKRGKSIPKLSSVLGSLITTGHLNTCEVCAVLVQYHPACWLWKEMPSPCYILAVCSVPGLEVRNWY